ncbi:unnamed protein product [Closterium sp. NIES-53]
MSKPRSSEQLAMLGKAQIPAGLTGSSPSPNSVEHSLIRSEEKREADGDCSGSDDDVESVGDDVYVGHRHKQPRRSILSGRLGTFAAMERGPPPFSSTPAPQPLSLLSHPTPSSSRPGARPRHLPHVPPAIDLAGSHPTIPYHSPIPSHRSPPIPPVVLGFALAIFLTSHSHTSCSAFDGGGGPPPSPTGALGGQPMVILVSFDGFRHGYHLKADTPNLNRMLAEGTFAEHGMLPVFPSLTFPSHHSMATGLLPASHGIIANKFRLPSNHSDVFSPGNVEPRWWLGEPIWTTVNRQLPTMWLKTAPLFVMAHVIFLLLCSPFLPSPLSPPFLPVPSSPVSPFSPSPIVPFPSLLLPFPFSSLSPPHPFLPSPFLPSPLPPFPLSPPLFPSSPAFPVPPFSPSPFSLVPLFPFPLRPSPLSFPLPFSPPFPFSPFGR